MASLRHPRRSACSLALAVIATVSVAACGPDDDAGDTAPIPDAGLAVVPELFAEVAPSVVAVAVDDAARPGEGSGVIVGEGLIVTNEHVVGAATNVRVVLADGTRLPAEVIATDAFTDLALLRVERQGLPVLELSTEYPTVGELAVVIGNPLGFENTVTAGIISGIGRAIPAAAALGQQALVDLIQTDAAISPGNSGGALVGADGRVIGISVAYIPPTFGAVNIGFAIPSPTVIDVVEQLLADGVVRHAYVGVQLTSVTQQIARELALETDRGVGVIVVEPGAPAAEAGLEPGDVITAIDDLTIDDLPSFLTIMRRYAPGDRVELIVVRDGETRTVALTMGTRPTG